ncbi:MAG: DUF3579 domain-containing protein [Gammaproteobacteria bacterium]
MKNNNIVIQGVTREGNKFRPSDWAERLYYALASYGHDRRLKFNPRVHIKMGNKFKSFVIDPVLEQEDPMTFDFLIDFANSNNLVISSDNVNAASSTNASTAQPLPHQASY